MLMRADSGGRCCYLEARRCHRTAPGDTNAPAKMRHDSWVDAASSSGAEREVQKQKFEQLFGVTEDELERQGIDPGSYARKNVRNALKDQSKWNGLIPRSTQLSLLWTRWGLPVLWRLFSLASDFSYFQPLTGSTG